MSAHIAPTTALHAVRNLLHQPREAYERLAAYPPNTLLLSGPPGVGKTKAVFLAARDAHLPVFPVSPGPNLQHRLLVAFQSASHPDPTHHRDIDTHKDKHNPSCNEQDPIARATPAPHAAVVFIDEIDEACPAPLTHGAPPSPSAATALLAAELDACRSRLPYARARTPRRGRGRGRGGVTVYVIAATNRPLSVHPSLMRAGRFELHVAVAPPDAAQRFALLRALRPAAPPDALRRVAERAAGYVVADLLAVSQRAARGGGGGGVMHSEGQNGGSDTRKKDEEEGNNDEEKKLLMALRAVRPSVLRTDVAPSIPDTAWKDIAGMGAVKKRLQMAVEWPLKHGATFARLGLSAARGILLHGPPGCSKTSLVRAAACEAGTPFLRVTAADVYSCYVGEAERLLRRAFAKARAAAPCILFVDEIDAMVGKRAMGGGAGADGNRVQQRVLSTLLTEMDGVTGADGVVVVGATNRLDMLDEALLRPGRFDDVLEVGLPDYETRVEVLEMYGGGLQVEGDVDWRAVAGRTEGWSGADLKRVCAEAGMAVIRERVRKGGDGGGEMRVTMADVERVLDGRWWGG